MSDNFLNSGAVLPHGLLGVDPNAKMAGFNKTYKNYPLRVGVILKSYPVGDDNNVSDLTTEYDVMVFEQYEDKGATTIIYRNCMSAEGLGSIADFFEKTLRPMKAKTSKGDSIKMEDQNGAVVLLMCLDGMSDKGIIMGAITHPNRETTLKDAEPHLEGEYNGVHVVVNSDGSTSLTFKGATDNDGKQTDASQGNTVVSIEKDGSFQVGHSTITFRMDRNGIATLTSTNNLVINCKDANVTASGNINAKSTDATVTASGTATVEGQTVKLGAGAAEAVIKGDTFVKYFQTHIHGTPIGPSSPPTQPVPASALSTKVKVE